MSKFGSKIIQLRKSKEWSQDKLAEELEVSRQTIYNWESGFAVPPADKLAEISEIFKVPIGSFFGEEIAIADATLQTGAEEGQEVQNGAHKGRRNLKALKIGLLSFCGVGIVVLSIWLAIVSTTLFSNRGDDYSTGGVWRIQPSDLFIILLIAIVILICIIVIICTISAIRKKNKQM